MQSVMDFGSMGWVVSIVAAVALACLWIWRRWWAPRAEGPRCGKCGYDVRGLPSSTCPECGSDLGAVGIIKPGTIVMGPGMKLLCWTLMMVMLSPALVYLGVWYGPAYRHEQASYELVPNSKAYSAVRVQYYGEGVGTRAPVKTVKCLFDPPNQITVILEVYQGGLTCSYPDQKWQQVCTAFDEAAILTAMQTGAVDTSSEAVKAEAAELHRVIRGISDGSGREVSPVNFTWWSAAGMSRRVEMPHWVRYAYLGVCAMVWRVGWWWMGRGERRSARVMVA